MYCLAMHPDVMKRLREEILSVIGPNRYPTYDDLREMKYLRAVINGTSLSSQFFGFNGILTLSYHHRRGPEVVSSCVRLTKI